MERYPIASLRVAEISEKCGKLVDTCVQFLIRDGLRVFVLWLWDPNESCLVSILLQMTVNAVVARVQPASNKPLPERRIARVQGCMPVSIPGQQISIFPEAFR